jgi:tetratricopeptide (TPR) repeat protein
MPGAVAYHLHSYSAHVLRTPDQYWVGPLLAKGVTATIGYVEEPYLEWTINVAALMADLTFYGFSFGEAAYAAQQVLSWQTTVVGDPLYCPFGRKNPGDQVGDRFRDLHLQLLEHRNTLIEWSHLQVVNLNLARGFSASDAIGYLEQEPSTQRSSVLLEKLSAMYYTQGKLADAFDANARALKLPMTPWQRVRVMLAQAQLLVTVGKEGPALDLYQQFLKEFPDYPEQIGIYQKMLPLARSLKKPSEVERIQQEIERLSPPVEK